MPGEAAGFPPIMIAGDPSNRILIIQASPGPHPPGPYCQWQDRFSAAAIRDQVVDHFEQTKTPAIATLATWSIAWNEDPQPLLVLRQMREESMVESIAVMPPPNDIHCVVPLMRSGLIDAVITPIQLINQSAMAAILPTAAETATKVIATDVLRDLPSQMIASDLQRYGLDQHYQPGEAAIQFVCSHRAVASILVDSAGADTYRSAMSKADLPAALFQTFRRYHGQPSAGNPD